MACVLLCFSIFVKSAGRADSLASHSATVDPGLLIMIEIPTSLALMMMMDYVVAPEWPIS